MSEGDEPVAPHWVIRDETHLFVPYHDGKRGWDKSLQAAEAMAQHMGKAMAETAKAFEKLLETVPVVTFAQARLNRWTAPPATVMERAIEAKKHRSTGPARPSAASARRPRRHQ